MTSQSLLGPSPLVLRSLRDALIFPLTMTTLAMEGDETFVVVLVTPPDVTSTSPGPSTVIIVDDDGALY